MSLLDRILGGLRVDPATRREMESILGLSPAQRARRTLRHPSQPITVEREYARLTRAIAEATEEAIRATILEYVEGEVEADALDFSQIARLIERLRELMRRIQALDIEEEIGRITERIVRWNAADLTAVLGIPLDAMDPRVLAALEPWRIRQAALIRDISAQMVERVQRSVEAAQQTGQRAEELAQVIEAEFGIGRRRAETIAVDQILTANARVTQERHQQAGVRRYEWNTSADDRVRPEHERVDGEVFDWSGPGAPGAGTGGGSAHPGEAIRCRCTAIPVFDDD